MAVVGFDFGTTNSLISVIRAGEPIRYLDDEQRPIPSVVCYEGTRKIVGRGAKERLAGAGLGIQGNIIRSPKMYLGREGIFIEGLERSTVDVVADVVSHVLSEARARGLQDVSGAVVTIPVDMPGYRRRALRDAFRVAGLGIVQFVHEPLAALYGLFRGDDLPAMLRRYDRKLILVFDWGGGTLDLTLCRPIGDLLVQLLNDGTDEVGGDVFDESIMNSLAKRVSVTRGMRELGGTRPGAKARLLDRCERAKIDLSSRSNVAIYVGNFFEESREEEFDYSLGRDELEEIVAPLLDKGFERIDRILQSAGYSAGEVALCLATGGMSNMPVVRQRLHERFGPERVKIPDGSATLIADGAAWIAEDRAALRLAKNVEISLARNSYLPLVKAGTIMPREGEVQQDTFHLYCTDPRDGVAKFQICTPRRAGTEVLPNEPRVHLENLTVRVDQRARPFRERLELDVRIDDDLVLEAHARSLNEGDQDRREIHNLEFGLAFPGGKGNAGKADDNSVDHGEDSERLSVGSLTTRANVADRVDARLVPGELLAEYDPVYFHPSRHPPEYQVHEHLYYRPCALCGRASNDPLCACSESRQ